MISAFLELLWSILELYSKLFSTEFLIKIVSAAIFTGKLNNLITHNNKNGKYCYKMYYIHDLIFNIYALLS